jgi:hypothetical protein
MEEKVKLIMSLGFSIDLAESLACERTLPQVRHWVSAAKDKGNPMAYFRAAHRRNEPVADLAEVKAAAARALEETANPEREARKRRRDKVYLTLSMPNHPWQEDTHEVRFSLLKEFGFHDLPANEMAKERTLAEIIQWIDASSTEENPWVFVRQQLTWGCCEPSWRNDERTPDRGEMSLMKQWAAAEKWLRLPDGRVVVQRLCPPEMERHTERLRNILGREPWSDYSEQGGIEMKIGFGISAALGLVEKPNPAERARERVKAILEAQAKESELSRSIDALKRDELMDDPFEEVAR